MQFNPEMPEQEAKRRAYELYKSTKGFRFVEKTQKEKPEAESKSESSEEPPNKQQTESVDKEQVENVAVKRVWKNGSESEMFNKLEEIARSQYPRTPVLEARITSTLEPENVSDDVIFKLNFIKIFRFLRII